MLSAFTNTLDDAGNPTTLTTTRGTDTTSEAYTYDAADRLTQVCYSTTSCTAATGETLSYTYDGAGNRLTQTRAGTPQAGALTYTYNAADELTSTSDGTTTTTYTYDPNGNLDTRGTDTYTYNLADQLTAATVNGTSHTYTYDGHDNRVTATTGGATTRTAWDRAHSVPQPAVDTDGAGATLASYLHGPTGPIAITADGQTSYTHRNRVGSITDLTNANGTPQRRYDYDPFGTARTDTALAAGAPTSALRYAGERLDPTGDYHLRARQYDPATGRFSALDPLLDITGAPYHYANNHPLLYTDPTGLISCGRLSFACDPVAEFVGDRVDNAGDALGAAGGYASDRTYDALNSGVGGVLSKTLVSIGNGATGGGAEWLVSQLSPGAECYYDELGGGYQLIQAGAAIVSAELTGALLIRGGIAMYGRGKPAFERFFGRGLPINDRGSVSLPFGPTARGLDPADVRFTQNTVSPNFRDGRSISDMVDGLRSGAVAPGDVPPIRLVERDGVLFSLDNRRLVAFGEAGVSVPYRMATRREVKREWDSKFTTTTDGRSIQLRLW